jgi:hypothetical protein
MQLYTMQIFYLNFRCFYRDKFWCIASSPEATVFNVRYFVVTLRNVTCNQFLGDSSLPTKKKKKKNSLFFFVIITKIKFAHCEGLFYIKMILSGIIFIIIKR